MNQHDDEPRRSSGGYVPFMPGQGPRPNRAQRRAKDQIRARGRRRMERATVRALKQAQRQDLRPQLQEDSVTVSVDLEEGTVTETRSAPAERCEQGAGVRHAPAPGYPCGTVGCSGTALWIPTSEGNRGMRTYRCHDCCDRIDNAYAKAVAE